MPLPGSGKDDAGGRDLVQRIAEQSQKVIVRTPDIALQIELDDRLGLLDCRENIPGLIALKETEHLVAPLRMQCRMTL